MKSLARIVAPLSLAATIIPAILFAFGKMSEDAMKLILLLATVGWFVTAPFWLKGAEE